MLVETRYNLARARMHATYTRAERQAIRAAFLSTARRKYNESEGEPMLSAEFALLRASESVANKYNIQNSDLWWYLRLFDDEQLFKVAVQIMD